MSKLKNIDIYVGTVGSAYVDKETALKNKQDAEINIIDVEYIITKAQAIKLALETSVTNSRMAENGAQSILNRLNSAIEEYRSRDLSKYLQLVELKENLNSNDTDGIYANGGNIRTATTNTNNATRQYTAINDIIAAAEVLLEDNRKLALIRSNEYDDAVSRFTQYVPEYEADTNEMSNNIENALNERLKEVQDNLNIIEDTIDAINQTTQEITDILDAIIHSEDSDTPVDVDGNVYYWYARQKFPLSEVLTSSDPDFNITENSVNTWHELKVVKTTVNDEIVSLLMASISSISTLSTWYVIVPADLELSPVKSDLITSDSRFTKLTSGFYTVDGKEYVCYSVNNDIPSISEDDSVLNIIMTSSSIVVPEEEVITGNYWYFGLQAPSQPYIKASDIVTDNESMGWRKIEGALSNYTVNNPYSGNVAIPVDDDNINDSCYLIVPQGTKIKDALGDIEWGTVYDTIVINNIPYTVYRDTGIMEFTYSLYIDSSNIPEPTGQVEPTGEPSVQTGSYYVYVGTSQPTSGTVISSELANTVNDKGWHYIGTTLDTYSAASPLFQPTEAIVFAGYNEVEFYLAIPGNYKVYDGLGNIVSYQSLGVISIDNISYNVYKGVSGEFAYSIY